MEDDTAESSSESTSESDAEPEVPVEEDERAAFHSGTVASGHETTEEDVDDVLYPTGDRSDDEGNASDQD